MTLVGETATMFEPPRCAHCGAAAPGRFCADCGSRTSPDRDLSIGHFLREAAAAITDLDSVLLRTFRTLFARPGLVTVEYLRGDRHRFLPPFKVFLFCNVIYFVVVATMHVNILTTSFRSQIDGMFYRDLTRHVLVERYHLRPTAVVQDGSATPRDVRDPRWASIESKFNGATEGIAKAIVVVLIPIYALILLALYAGTGRYFAEHLVFATHLVAALLIAIPACGLAFAGYQLIWYYATHRVVGQGEAAFVVALLAPFAVYTSVAQQTVYGGNRIATSVRTAVLAGSVALVIPAFKFVLFFVTLFWIGT